ncbi:transposase [bacterium]|nr:transposase [bacterium]
MSQYIRAQFDHPDDIYFLTLVTKDRHLYFDSPEVRKMILEAFDHHTRKQSGEVIAWVIMPDHLHIVIRQGTNRFSHLIRQFKRGTNLAFLGKQGTLWQPRFWEHRVRDEQDLRKYLDYIHANPVLAGLVELPEDYEASSYRIWLERGEYSMGWQGTDIKEPPWKGGE